MAFDVTSVAIASSVVYLAVRGEYFLRQHMAKKRSLAAKKSPDPFRPNVNHVAAKILGAASSHVCVDCGEPVHDFVQWHKGEIQCLKCEAKGISH